MAIHSVQQSGGDFTSLGSCLSDAGTGAGDTINIEGSWTVDDTVDCLVADDNLTITALGSSKHPGYWDTSLNHHRLVSASSAHAIQIDNVGAIIDGLAIHKTGTSTSEECVRSKAAGALTVKNCLVRGRVNADSQQDGIYTNTHLAVISVENCMIWDHERAGIHIQETAAETLVFNINSCTIWNCNADNGAKAGGIFMDVGSSVDATMNVFNTIVMDTVGSATDFDDDGSAGTTFDIHNCIDSDGSVSHDSGNVGCLSNRSTTDSDSPGAGDWVVFEDVTSSPYDFRIKTNAENDAENMHSTASGAGMSIPTTDIVGTTRTAPYECGAFSLGAVGIATVDNLFINQAINRAATY